MSKKPDEPIAIKLREVYKIATNLVISDCQNRVAIAIFASNNPVHGRGLVFMRLLEGIITEKIVDLIQASTLGDTSNIVITQSWGKLLLPVYIDRAMEADIKVMEMYEKNGQLFIKPRVRVWLSYKGVTRGLVYKGTILGIGKLAT